MLDSALSHRAKAAQDFLWNVVPDFISAEEWVLHSSDLNFLDYSVWDILHELVYDGWHQPYTNVLELEKAVEKTSSTCHNTGWEPVQHIFSWTLVNAADNWINTWWIFGILTCSTTCLVSQLNREISTYISVYISVNVCTVKLYI